MQPREYKSAFAFAFAFGEPRSCSGAAKSPSAFASVNLPRPKPDTFTKGLSWLPCCAGSPTRMAVGESLPWAAFFSWACCNPIAAWRTYSQARPIGSGPRTLHDLREGRAVHELAYEVHPFAELVGVEQRDDVRVGEQSRRHGLRRGSLPESRRPL